MPLKFIVSQKNKKHLLLNGFTYAVNRVNPEKVIWRCTNYYQNKCPGRCHTSSQNEDGNVLFEKAHNHQPELVVAEAKNIMAKVRQKATTSMESTSRVIASVSRDLPESVSGHLPAMPNMSRTVRRIRRKEKNLPPIARTLAELIIPQEYKLTSNHKLFLMCDSRELDINCNDKFIIFTTRENLNTLSTCSNWFSDETFRTVPPMFYQMYSIHGLVRSHVVPLVYVLMTGKSCKTYKAVLRQLCTLEPRLSPDVVMSDFELAYIKAVSKVFPRTSVRGCYFHFSQCIWRNIQSCGLQQQYGNDINYELNLKMLNAIAFVPDDDVVYAYEQLINTPFYVEHKDELVQLIEYYEATWVGVKLHRRGRRGPCYDITIWNHYDSVLSDLHKTNNNVESWHKNFNANADACHVNIWKFISLLQDEQSKTDIKIEQIYRGDERPAKKAKVESRHRRLKVAVENYDRDDIINYLRGIAHNL